MTLYKQFVTTGVVLSLVGILAGCGSHNISSSVKSKEGNNVAITQSRVNTSNSSDDASSINKQTSKHFHYSAEQINEIKQYGQKLGIKPFIPNSYYIPNEHVLKIGSSQNILYVKFSDFVIYDAKSLKALASYIGVPTSTLTKTEFVLPNGQNAWHGSYTKSGVTYTPIYLTFQGVHIIVNPLKNKNLNQKNILTIASTLQSY